MQKNNERPDFLQLKDARARGDMYLFLSAVYLRPPQPELLKCMTEGKALADLCRLFAGSGGPCSGVVRQAASNGQDSAALEQEYMDLFAVPAGRYVFPFEDVYRGGDGFVTNGPLLGNCAIDVCRFYRDAGGRVDPECRELPTHIGVQLSFMSFACRQEVEALRDPGICGERVGRIRRLQLGFLTRHLNEWFPDLARAIRLNAATAFYPAIARMTEEFLLRDTAYLQHSLEGE